MTYNMGSIGKQALVLNYLLARSN